jgi:hypothetical protein
MTRIGFSEMFSVISQWWTTLANKYHHSHLSDFEESYPTNATAVYECRKSESARANERLGIFLFVNMELNLAKILCKYE